MTSGSVLHLTGGDTAGGGDWARVGTVRGWVSSAVVFPTSVDAWDTRTGKGGGAFCPKLHASLRAETFR